MDFADSDSLAEKADAIRAAEAAALRAAEREDDEKKQAGRDAGGDMGNPADADLSANIRPDVVAVPGGLVTITTAKSATYHPEPETPEHATAAHEVRYLNEWTNAPHDDDPATNEAWAAATNRLAEFDRRAELEALPAIEVDPPSMFLEDHDEWSRGETAAEYVAGRLADADANDAEAASRHNEQQNESARSSEASDGARGDESMTAADYVASRLADAKASTADHDEKEVMHEVEAAAESARGRDGPDIF